MYIFCYISTGEKKNLTQRIPKARHAGLLRHHPATGLLWPHPRPWASQGLRVTCHLQSRGICHLVGTVSEDGAKRCQKAKVTPLIFPASSNSMEQPWGQLNATSRCSVSSYALSHPQPVNSPVFAPRSQPQHLLNRTADIPTNSNSQPLCNPYYACTTTVISSLLVVSHLTIRAVLRGRC